MRPLILVAGIVLLGRAMVCFAQAVPDSTSALVKPGVLATQAYDVQMRKVTTTMVTPTGELKTITRYVAPLPFVPSEAQRIIARTRRWKSLLEKLLADEKKTGKGYFKTATPTVRLATEAAALVEALKTAAPRRPRGKR